MDSLVFNGWIFRALRTGRATAILAAFFAMTVPLMAFQFLFLKFGLRLSRTLPHLYHRWVCRLAGIRLHIQGTVAEGKPVLLVSNHLSWLDIPILSAVTPVCFVSKMEVASWPFASVLAKLQRSVFVDRTRKSLVKDKAGEIAERLRGGDTIVLFAEGTSSDGNRVLPFKTSLFSAARQASLPANDNGPEPLVQTVALAYTHLHGIPLLRHERPLVAWYGEMDMLSHVWTLLKSGPLDVTVRIGAPVPLSSVSDRKELAAFSEAQVRSGYSDHLTARPHAA